MDSCWSTRFAALSIVCLGLHLACCDADPQPEETAEAPRAPEEAPPAAHAPTQALPTRASKTGLSPSTPEVQGPAPPVLGCHVVDQHVVGRGLGAARLAARADGVWVASYARRQGERWLARFHLAPGVKAVRALTELPLGESTANSLSIPPAIAAGHSLWIASVDDRGNVKLWPDADHATPEAVAVATGVDRRFTPALRALSEDAALLAWTEGDATGMRVMAASMRNGRVKKHPVTPPGHGASAPRFIAGAPLPRLLMLDAHAGVSPLLIVPFSTAGLPEAAHVARPVSQPYAPPSLVGIALPELPAQVAYTAIGNAATAAVGIVDANSTLPPQALLPGTGYAQLSVDATLGPRHAVFAMDAPQTREKSPPLAIHVRVWDGKKAGPPLVLATEGTSQRRPGIAYDATRGLFALSALRDEGLWMYWLRCDA